MRKYASLEVLEAWRQAVPGDPGSAVRRIVKAAHRVAFDYEPRPGYLYVRSRMISSRTNDNHDTFPAEEIEKGYRSFLGKPVFVNHHNANHRRARGVIVAVALHRDANGDGTPDTWVEGLMEVDAVRFPKLAQAILAGRVNRTSMGVDVDWSRCSACGNKATSPAEYCKHLPAMKGKKIRQRNKVTGKVEEKLIHEVCAGLSFFENSLLVEDPADPTAAVLDVPDARGLKGLDMAPRTARADRRDGHVADAVPVRDPLKRELAPSRTAPAYRYQGQKFVLDDPDVGVGELDSRVAYARQAAPLGHHVGRVDRVGAQEPVPYVHADLEVARVADHQLRRDRAAQQLPPVAVRPDARAPRVRQGEARVAAVERAARPRVAGIEPWLEIDRRKVAVNLGDRADELSAHFGPADHGIYSTASAQDLRTFDQLQPHEQASVAHYHPQMIEEGNAPAGSTPHDYLYDSRQEPKAEFLNRYMDADDEFKAAYGPDEWEAHHAETLATHPIPRYPAEGRWPLIVSDANPNYVDDGYHRMHSYMRDGATRIPTVRMHPRTASSGPDFRDHVTNPCTECGRPVSYSTGRERAGRYPWTHRHNADMGHEAVPSDPADRQRVAENPTFSAGHCLVCGDAMSINLNALDRPGGGFHHADGMKRGHEALPGDEREVYDSITRQKAARDQARQVVRDHLHSQFEQLSGRPLPRRPRGDEDQMPPDPFTAARRKKPHGRPVKGHGRDPRFDGVGLKKDRNGFYVHNSTHRSRSDSYPTPDDIPESDIEDIRATGAKTPPAKHPWFMNHPVSAKHIVHAYEDSSDDERALGDRWYSDAHHVAKLIGKGDAALGAGLLSAYSPRTLWPVNLFNASRASQGDPPGPGSGALGDHQRKAIRILGGEHHSRVLTAPKTAAFAHLIEHGGDSDEDKKTGHRRVVIDRHAMSVAAGRRLTDEDTDKMPVSQPQHYEHVSRAYRSAARYLSAAHGREISPHQVQATTWLRQVRKNAEEDASGAKGAGGKGRVQMGDNSRRRWVEHHHQHHPGGIPEENMHYHGSRDEPVSGWAHSTDRCTGCGNKLDEDGNPFSARNPALPWLCTWCSSQAVPYPDHQENPDLAGGSRRSFTGRDYLPPSLSTRQAAVAEGGTHCVNCGSDFSEVGHPRSRMLPMLCQNCLGSIGAKEDTAMPGYLNRREQRDVIGGNTSRPMDYKLRQSVNSLAKQAYGETRMPPQVDTLRMDECPVCGEHNVWSGSRCPVCGFVVPPSVFRDPDTDKAKEVREQLDGTGEVDLPPDAPDAAQPDAALPTAQVGSGDDADGQLVHPDQIAPDGVPTVQGGDDAEGAGGTVPGEAVDPAVPEPGAAPDPEAEQEEAEAQEAGELEDEDQDEAMFAEELICPACGTTFEADAAAQPGVPCPACGMAALHPADEEGEPGEEDEDGEEDGGDEEDPGDPRKEQEDPSEPDEEPGDEEDEEDEDQDMPADRKTAAALAQAQARRIAELSAQNEVLSAQLRFLASAAGIDRELAEVGRRVMHRHADILNPASPVPDPPQAPPTETTEQALQPESMDNAGRPGTTPGANSRVPAAQTTTAITPGVEMQTPPATNLVDVTAPVQGTNPSQDGGVPVAQRRIETDVRVDPDPLKAHGPGIGGQGDNGSAFPWILDARQPDQQGAGGQVNASLGEADASRRTYASIRLAKLRVQAGLAQGEELAVAERIERDAAMSVPVIEHEISTLEQLGRSSARQPQRPQQRTAARAVPSLASVGASASYAPAVMDDLDASDLFD